MTFLAISFLTVALPYGLERFYFKKRFGGFALLFWLYVFQVGILFASEFILKNEIDQLFPGWIKSVGFGLAFINSLTIAFTPFAAALCALIVGLILATNKEDPR